MENTGTKRVKLSDRINAYVSSDTPIRKLAGNWSNKAKTAMDEANSLSLEHVEITLKRLPKKLDGFKIVQLSDTHHSPFTTLEHIKRAVKIANRDYRLVEMYTFVAVVYFIISFGLSRLVRLLQARIAIIR